MTLWEYIALSRGCQIIETFSGNSSDMQYDASLIVCTYNQQTLDYVLDAITEEIESEKHKVEIIIADDGSTDSEVQEFLSLTSEYNSYANCQIKYIWQQDLGFRFLLLATMV